VIQINTENIKPNDFYFPQILFENASYKFDLKSENFKSKLNEYPSPPPKLPIYK